MFRFGLKNEGGFVAELHRSRKPKKGYHWRPIFGV
jgi:hypothetical protein